MKKCVLYIISGLMFLVSGVLVANLKAANTEAETFGGDNIAVAGKILSMEQVGNTLTDAEKHVNKYGDKLIYGHNLSEVFGGLKTVNEGDYFTVTEDEVETTYRVAEKVVFDKVSDLNLELDGQRYTMGALANNAFGYDLALMTCDGEGYGDGDATQRLVIFAERV